MNYKIINNLSKTENHSMQLKNHFVDSDSVILTSPFLMNDFSDFFREINLCKIKNIHLITTLIPKSFDQIRKINSLISFIKVLENKDIIQVSLNNKLHGKIYIFKKGGEYISAIVSSANFTNSGLLNNHEWGIEIYDKDEIKKLEKSILDNIEIPNLSFDKIFQMKNAAKDFSKKLSQTESKEIDLNLLDFVNLSSSPFNNNINFWLKPIGITENPVTEDRLFDTLDYKLYFSKVRPKGVKIDDTLIVYGVGTTKILSIYRVTSNPIISTQEEIEKDNWIERWPWYVHGYNLTPKFGSTWYNHNLYINSLKKDFLSIYPNESITFVGGKTLGALNFGKDKLKLSQKFAKFIIDKVVSIDKSFI